MITKIARYNLQMHRYLFFFKKISDPKFYYFLSAEIGRLPEVKTAAKMIGQLQYDYKDSLLASLIVGGYDPINGPKLYTLSVGGSIVECNYSLGGSGSGYIYGFVDANFRINFSLEEAKKFLLTGFFCFV